MRNILIATAALVCMIGLAGCSQKQSLGPTADAAEQVYLQKLEQDPSYRESRTLDGVSFTLPAGWFEVPLAPGASNFARHLFIHGDRTREHGFLPIIRVFFYPKSDELSATLFTDEKTFNDFAMRHITLYSNARLQIDPVERTVRHVYKCLAKTFGAQVFRCSTIMESEHGIVEIQFQERLELLADVNSYYLDVEALMQSVHRQ